MTRAANIVLRIAVLAWSLVRASAESTLPRHAGAVDESYPGHFVQYDQFANAAGNRVRLIVTAPNGGGRFATIFVAGWLSCDTVEAPGGTQEATSLVFRRLAALPNVALVRMEKEGVGDSEGDCAQTDFNTELEDYRGAFRRALAYPFVDPRRMFILGISNGGGFAPLVAGENAIAGYVIDGGWLKTWFEHMMEIERRRLALSGKSPGEVDAVMKDEEHFYARFLLGGEMPRDIFKTEPSLARIWNERDADHQYGRPVAYYQQLQALNLAQAWSRVSVPTLILHGQYDWIMSADDSRTMKNLVDMNTGGAARFLSLPDTGHTFEHYASEADAFAGREEPFDPSTADVIADWLEAQLGEASPKAKRPHPSGKTR